MLRCHCRFVRSTESTAETAHATRVIQSPAHAKVNFSYPYQKLAAGSSLAISVDNILLLHTGQSIAKDSVFNRAHMLVETNLTAPWATRKPERHCSAYVLQR